MTTAFPLDRVDQVKLAAVAEQARRARDVPLPPMPALNMAACAEHAHLGTPQSSCRRCGLASRRHQRVAGTWLFFVRKGLLADPCGSGKAQPLSSKVLTPTGWRCMGDLVVGDAVSSPSGEVSQVTGVFPQGIKQTYRVRFSDGSVAESSLDHLWRVRSWLDLRNQTIWKTMTLGEIVESMRRDAPRYRGRSAPRWAVPLVSAPVEHVASELPVDPYLLGALLGDGSIGDTVRLTSADPSLLADVAAVLPEGVWLTDAGERSGARNVRLSRRDFSRPNPLRARLSGLGLVGCGAAEKFVPEMYLTASVKDRIAVLQGLLDTDGSVSVNGRQIEFGSASERLRDAVVALARSLGFKASARPAAKHRYWNREHQEWRVARDRYRCLLVPTDEIEPFRLQRKLDALVSFVPGKQARQYVKWIKSVEPVREEEHQCISVSSSDHLYVTDDYTVTHNTASATIALAMAYQAGELNVRRGGGRALVICRPSVTGQWQDELRRFVPGIGTAIAAGTPAERGLRYAEPWDALLIGSQTFLRDKEIIGRLGIKHLIVDDIDSIRHAETQTAWAVKELAVACQRVVILSATPLQKRLDEMYDLLSIIGGKQVFGSKTSFVRRYTKRENVVVYTPGGIKRTLKQTVGHRNLGEFKALLAPMALRRPIEALDDVEMPSVEANNVFLELYPAQRARYDELKSGVLRFLRDQGTEIKNVTAIAKLIYGSQICEGLAALDEEELPDTSIKFDWLLDRLTGDWSGESDDDPGEKVVVFVQYKNGVRALQRRLAAAGIDHVTVWGEERGLLRDQAVRRFWDDPASRVLIGTAAIEQSLNLQIARHLVNVDQLMNPARMVQLAGRVRRDGSRFGTVYVHNLLTIDTHEERILRLLETEAALSTFVWGEADPIYAPLTPVQMLQLIAPDEAHTAA